MSSPNSPASLLARIRKLTDRIVKVQAKFDLPKDDPDRFATYGGAASLQADRTERAGLQAQLPPLKVVAEGVSCRDCALYLYMDGERLCTFAEADDIVGLVPCDAARASEHLCGQSARCFKPKTIIDNENMPKVLGDKTQH